MTPEEIEKMRSQLDAMRKLAENRNPSQVPEPVQKPKTPDMRRMTTLNVRAGADEKDLGIMREEQIGSLKDVDLKTLNVEIPPARDKEVLNSNPNPLSRHFRTVQLTVRLATDVSLYEPGTIELNAGGTLDILPMSGTDEIMLKTPDALLNGSAMERLITSCAPGVKKVRKLLAPDLEIVLLGIRAASQGPDMEISLRCPNCNHENSYDMNIPATLAAAKRNVKSSAIVTSTDVTLHFRPFDFDMMNRSMMVEFQTQQIVRVVQASDSSEEEKLDAVRKGIEKTYELNKELFADCIIQAETPDGIVVNNKKHLIEFIENVPKQDYRAIEAAIKAINDSGLPKTVDLVCGSCSQTNQVPMNYDPTYFFG